MSQVFAQAIAQSKSKFDHRQRIDLHAVTVLAYQSAPNRVRIHQPQPNGLNLRMPDLSDCAARCLSFGVGSQCGEMIAELASAQWFSHLESTFWGATDAATSISRAWASLPANAKGTHVASIALPKLPTKVELETAYELGRGLRNCGTFVIITMSDINSEMLKQVGQVTDCILLGDCGILHHSYPARTIVEPAIGRLVCYDLYDVCSLWAGHVGKFGVIDPQANGLHVEISSLVSTLAEVDALAHDYGNRLENPDNLHLFNVVEGTGLQRATPVSFTSMSFVRQERSTKKHHSADANL